MYTLFISDLHLEDKRPEATGQLVEFLRGAARQADALYILGDLFEFWIGDDVRTETSQQVAAEISDLKNYETPCYFLGGNRDFLLGEDYARQAGMELLPDASVVNFYGKPSLLLHGDTLCTDDVEYQAFRQQVRNPEFQKMFLAMSPEQRLVMAQNARDASKQHMGSVSTEIMDVNENAVIEAFEHHKVWQMIHGHTHRPSFHIHTLPDGWDATRLVLADWYHNGSYLQLDSEGFSMHRLTQD